MRWLAALAVVLVAITVIGRTAMTGSLGFGQAELDGFFKPFFVESADRSEPLVLIQGLPRVRHWQGKLLVVGHGALGTRVLEQQEKLPDEVRARKAAEVDTVAFLDLVEQRKEVQARPTRVGWSLELYVFDWRKKALLAHSTLRTYGAKDELHHIKAGLPDVLQSIRQWRLTPSK